MAEVRFAAYLGALLAARHMLPINLAQALYVDSSVVYRWLRDERIPRLDSSHIEAIAKFLALSNAERERLEKAQIVSLKSPHSASASTEERQDRLGVALAKPAGDVYGARTMIEAAIGLLETLPPVGADQTDTTIFLTFQGQDAFEKFPDLHVRWHEACYHALHRGWTIHHLWRLDENPTRTLELLQHSLNALGVGRYIPYYFKQHELLRPPYDLLIIPHEDVAMWLFATENPEFIDAAVVLQYDPLIKRLRGHFHQLEKQAEPVFRVYQLQDPQEQLGFWAALEEAEERPTNRYLVKKSGLSTLTRPPSWYQDGSPWAEEAKKATQRYDWVLRHYERRWNAFNQKATTSMYREMCPMRAINALVETGLYPRDNVLGIRYQAQPSEVRAHLQHLIDLLAYEQYELALLDEDEEAKMLTGPFWEVTGGESAFLQIWSQTPSGQDLDLGLKVTETSIVQAFETLFERLWKQVHLKHRTKDWVKWWLAKRISS